MTGEPPTRAAAAVARPYESPDELKADLETVLQSLIAEHGPAFAYGDLPDLIRAVDTFGFHLARLDMRQNSSVHERTVAELLKTAGVCADYAALDEAARIALLVGELGHGRLLHSPYETYGEETNREFEILRTAAEVKRLYGRDSMRAYIVSNTTSVSDLLEVYLLLKEVGLFTPGERRGPRSSPSRCSRPSATCARRRRPWAPTWPCRSSGGWSSRSASRR